MNKRRIAVFMVVALIVSLLSGDFVTVRAAAVTELYVSSNGNDSSAGTLDAPLATIAKAVNKVPENGVANIYLLSNLELDGTSSITIPEGKHIRILSGNTFGCAKADDFYTVLLTNPENMSQSSYIDVKGELAIEGVCFTMNLENQEAENAVGKSVFNVAVNGMMTVTNGASIQGTSFRAITVEAQYSYYTRNYDYGTLFMDGGTITGNRTGIYLRGKMYMSGGTITENSNGAVGDEDSHESWTYDVDANSYGSAKLYLSGNPLIGNIGVDDYDYAPIKVEGELNIPGEKKIGVYDVVATTRPGLDEGTRVIGGAENGYSLTQEDVNSFSLGTRFKEGGELTANENTLLYARGCMLKSITISKCADDDSKEVYVEHDWWDEDSFDLTLGPKESYFSSELIFETTIGAKLYVGGQEIINNRIPVNELLTATSGAITLTCESLNGETRKDYTLNYNREVLESVSVGDAISCFKNEKEWWNSEKHIYIAYYTSDKSELSDKIVSFTVTDGWKAFTDKDEAENYSDDGSSEDQAIESGTRTWLEIGDKKLYLAKVDEEVKEYTLKSEQYNDPSISFFGVSPDSNHEIHASVPYGTDITHLKPVFGALSNCLAVKVNGEYQYSGISEQDFTYPVTYDLTSVSGSAISIEVSVEVEEQETHQVNYVDGQNMTNLTSLPDDYNDTTSFLEGEGLAEIPSVAPYQSTAYNFIGWYTSPVGGKKVDSIKANTTEDVMLYAHWERSLVRNITYKNHNGEDITNTLDSNYDAAKTYTCGIGLANVPETEPYPNTGYHFLGWYDATTDGTKVTSIGTSSKYDITLYARWGGTITYKNHNGEDITDTLGSNYDTAKFYTYRTELTVPQTAPYTYSGYRFLGWYDAETDGTKVTSIGAECTGDITLYARWTRNSSSKSDSGVWTPKYKPTAAPSAPSADTKTPTAAPTAPSAETKIPTTPASTATPAAESSTPSKSETSSPVLELNIISDEPVKATTKGKDNCFYANGKKITSEFVNTPKGNLVAVDSKGDVICSSIIVVKDNKSKQEDKYYAGKNGVIKKNNIVTTSDGTKYFAGEDGKLVTNDFVDTKKGNTYYCTKTGEIAKSTVVKVGNKSYYAYASGKIAKSAMITQKDGTRYYAKKSGELAHATFVTYKGYRYYALTSGKIVKSQEMVIGDTKYKFNKYGIIVKETKVSAKKIN